MTSHEQKTQQSATLKSNSFDTSIPPHGQAVAFPESISIKARNAIILRVKKHFFFVGYCTVACLGVSYAQETEQPKESPLSLDDRLYKSAERKIKEYISVASGNSLTTSTGLLSGTLFDFYLKGANARSAVQATQVSAETTLTILLFQAAQNQQIIEQNKRIIELLEQQAKPPAKPQPPK